MATIRTTPEDFVVEELPLYPPHGEGPFTLIWIEKRLRNSDDVAREIADHFGLEPRAVGYAGRKDRRAVTRQWFSVPEVAPEASRGLDLGGVEVLDAIRHRHPLRPGDLKGNRFEITVRHVAASLEDLERERSKILREGMSNRFGRQRYGRHGDNAALGRRVLAGERLAGDRRSEGFYLSALQSELFDEVEKRRRDLIDLMPGGLLQGDLAWEHATGGLRPVLLPADHEDAAARLEISPTGPILGHKMRSPKGAALALEKQAAADLELPWIYDLPRLRRHHLSGGRRPLRVPVGELEIKAGGDPGSVDVVAVLPPGSYVTVLLESLFPEGIDEVKDDAVKND